MIERQSDDENRTPLLDHVKDTLTNEKKPYHDGYAELPYYSQDHATTGPLPTTDSRRLRKLLVAILLVLGIALLVWKWYLRPQLQDEWDMKEGFMSAENSTYDVAKKGHFDGRRLETLDAKYLPGGKHDPKGERRLVFVGDIHGCSKELKKLLHKMHFDEEKDHLIAVGDVISKGPDNVGVLDELMRLGASSVRGNHEDRILAIAPSVLKAESEDDLESMSSGAKKDRKLLKHLHKKHLKYLRSMPLMLRVPALPQAARSSYKDKSPLAEEILVVHAGLVPAVALEKQDSYFVMNMRALRVKDHLPLAEASAKHVKTKPWHNIWDWYNDRLFRKKSVKDFRVYDELEDHVPTTGWDALLGVLGLRRAKKWPKPQVVVYGHHSKAGLQVERWSKGLDTGCVRGGELTAMVLDARGEWTLESVGCKDYR